jgi:hypothetical protein
MSLRTGPGGLGLYAYTNPSTSAYPLIVSDLAPVCEALEITSVAPGGFGDLACIVKLPQARIPRPELAIFARVLCTDGPFCVFAGEWADPALVLDGHNGEYVMLSALGGGVGLRDDPDESVYTSTTAQAIIAAEFTKRVNYLSVDADQSLVLPSAPASVFSPIYDGASLEEILHDLCFDLGDYTWAVWDHATHRDGAGYPTYQLSVHPRDTTTTAYTALPDDIASWRVTPSQQRAYNVVEVAYVDVTGGPAKVSVSDPRLGALGSQNLAPFRRRKLRRSLGRAPLTAAQATTIAQAWLAAYENVSNKVEIVLRSVRDANGVPLPLHQVRADRNLFVPELAVRASVSLPLSPTPATNQFYIVETIYREISNGDVTLTLLLDNYADAAASQLARLTLAYDAALRQRGTFRTVISPGTPVVGPAGAAFSNEAAGGFVGVVVSFPGVLPAVPSNVLLTPTGLLNATAAGTDGITRYGFRLHWTAVAAGATAWIGTYQTVP